MLSPDYINILVKLYALKACIYEFIMHTYNICVYNNVYICVLQIMKRIMNLKRVKMGIWDCLVRERGRERL